MYINLTQRYDNKIDQFELEQFKQESGLLHDEMVHWAIASIEEGDLSDVYEFDFEAVAKMYDCSVEDLEDMDIITSLCDGYRKDIEKLCDKYKDAELTENMQLEVKMPFNDWNAVVEETNTGITMYIPKSERAAIDIDIVEDKETLVVKVNAETLYFTKEGACENAEDLGSIYEDYACEKNIISYENDEWTIQGEPATDLEIEAELLEAYETITDEMHAAVEGMAKANPKFAEKFDLNEKLGLVEVKPTTKRKNKIKI
ncbi:hypothetical protein MA785_000801 [Vibrio parahaemolyticus]|nr:hypothetical protein [Vibrio parahaemolyticus]EJR2787910.1 hypothetical protein [Vibrio parahaemolyticus]